MDWFTSNKEKSGMIDNYDKLVFHAAWFFNMHIIFHQESGRLNDLELSRFILYYMKEGQRIQSIQGVEEQQARGKKPLFIKD